MSGARGLLAGALGGAARGFSGVAQGQIDLNLKKQLMEAEEDMRNRLDEATGKRQSAENDRQYTRARADQLADDKTAWERGAPERAQQSEINQRTIARADQALASGDLEAAEAAELEALRDRATSSTGEDRYKAIEDLEIQLDKFTPRFSTSTAYVAGEDEYGAPTETRVSVRSDRFTGDYGPVGGNTPAATDESDPLGIRGLFDQQPTPATQAPAASAGLLEEQLPPAQSVAPPAASAAQPSADILAGFTLPESRTRPPSVSAAPRPSTARVMETEADAVVREVQQVLASRDLRPLAGRGMREKVEQALASGKLSEQDAATLEAFLARQ